MQDKNRKKSTKKKKLFPLDVESRIAHYTEEIAKLQAQSLELNQQNQDFADQYNQLTAYNQALGDDLAKFEREIENLENEIPQKHAKFEVLCKETEKLEAQIRKYRKKLLKKPEFKEAAMKLQRYEAKKKAIMNHFKELKGESLKLRGDDLIQTREQLIQSIRLTDEYNAELTKEISILGVINDYTFTNSEKQSRMDVFIKEKEEEIQRLQEEYESLQEHPKPDEVEIIKKEIRNSIQLFFTPQKQEDTKTFGKATIFKPFQDKSKTEINVTTQKKKNGKPVPIAPIPMGSLPPLSLDDFPGQSSTSRLTSSRILANQAISHDINTEYSRNAYTMRKEIAPSDAAVNHHVARLRPTRKPDSINYQERFRTLATQTVEEEFEQSPEETESSEILKREKETENKIIMLNNEIEAKKLEKQQLEEMLASLNSELNFSEKTSLSIMPLPDYLKAQYTKRNSSSQTDTTGEIIDFHYKILAEQEQDLEKASDLETRIKELKMMILEEDKKIKIAKKESELKDTQLNKIRGVLEDIKSKIENDQLNQDLETRMKTELTNQIKQVKNEIRAKQQEYREISHQNEELRNQLEGLIHKKSILERDLDDSNANVPDNLRQLNDGISTYQRRIEEVKLRLTRAEAELVTKRQTLEALKKSEDMTTYKTLMRQQTNFERRAKKWKQILKHSRETLQSMESYSMMMYGRRKQLREMLVKYELLKEEREEQISDLERYSNLLDDLLEENAKNWS